MLNQEWITKHYKLGELDQLLLECEDAIEHRITSEKIKDESDNRTFLLYTVGKSFVSAREIIMLCWSGFPDGALSISRNVFEQFITVAYMESKVDSVDSASLFNRYNDDYTVQLAKALRFDAQYVNVDENAYKKYDDEIAAIKKRYDNQVKNDYWWTIEPGMTFSKLCDYVANDNAEMVQFIRLMQLLYKRACLSLHASNMGNRIRVGSDIQCIDMGPWDEGQENALFLLTASLIYIVGATFHVINIKEDEIIKQLNDLALYYCGIIKDRMKSVKESKQG